MVAMTVHEWAHAFAAYKLGDPTAKNLGRMLSIPSNTWTRSARFAWFCLVFGWARQWWWTRRNLKNYRRDDAIISLAGPFMNLLTAFLFTGIFVLVIF